jgi:hypothetical protein
MPDDDPFPKVFQLLDVLASQIATIASEMATKARVDQFEGTMQIGFANINRRLDSLDTRLERITTEFRTYRHENDQRISALES